ncbi:MAG: hypothetical protein ACOZQL_15180 [Myxococcota bacterium]
MRLVLLAVFLTFAACGALTPPPADAGQDAGTSRDAGDDDAGMPDAGGPDASVDAGSGDAGSDAGSTFDAGLCDGGFCPPEKITGQRIDPWDVAVDGQNVYWLEYGLNTGGLDGQLMRQAKNTVCLVRDAGCADDLNMSIYGRFRVDTMTLTGDEVCWTESYADQRDVVCQSLTTNAERFIARQQKVATRPFVANGELWWVNQGTSAAAREGQVMHSPLTGTPAPSAVVSMRPSPTSAAVLNGHVAWAEAGESIDAGAVWAAPLDGGAAFLIASGQRTPLSLIACGGSLFWVNYRDAAVMRGALAPDSGLQLVGQQKGPFQVICDGERLFWLNEGVSSTGADGELWQAALDGGAAVAMVRGIPIAWALAADETYVYWIAQGTVTRLEGALWKMRKRP